MTQEFVTLPREVVEQAIDALYCTNSKEGSPTYNFELKAIKELRAALEQQPTTEKSLAVEKQLVGVVGWRNHIPNSVTVVHWTGLIPPVGTELYIGQQPQVEQELCCESWSVNRIDDLGKIVDSSGRLIATVYGLQAEKIVACHNSHAKQQPQVEQEPVGEVGSMPGTTGFTMACFHASDAPVGTKLYTHQQNLNCKSTQARLAALWGYVKEQPKREPLTESAIVDIVIDMNGNEPTALFWRDLARAIEAAHDIK